MNYKNVIGFGVAGNFAGHLEQAGEANDFLAVKTQEAIQPKAIFPFYVPSEKAGFLSVYPLSSNKLRFPDNSGDNLQIEPEIAILCHVIYQSNQVVKLIPYSFGAYNDCSIRRPNANKICEKKNWGAETKGLSDTLIPLTSFELGGEIDKFRIACFHRREEKTEIYGVDSPALGYSYFHTKLLDWIVDRMNNQPDQGPMNNIAELLAIADYPTEAIISIGATRYTEFGESHYLQKGDTSIVVVYNGEKYTKQQILEMAQAQSFPDDMSALIQKVI